MNLLPKSEISFELTKEDLIQARNRPTNEYHWWLKFKKMEQIIDNLINLEASIRVRKF